MIELVTLPLWHYALICAGCFVAGIVTGIAFMQERRR